MRACMHILTVLGWTAGVGAVLAEMQIDTEALSKNVIERVGTALNNLAALDMFTE